jgi:hypothetical protein
LYQDHKGRVEFLLVLIREAGHPVDRIAFLRQAPLQGEAHWGSIRKALDILGLTLPAFKDSDDGEVEVAFDAWPKRLLVLDTEGRIALDAGHGLPRGWDFGAVDMCLRRRSR